MFLYNDIIQTSENMAIKPTLYNKGKSVPLHAMEAHGGKGGIAPTHT
jgi:hypothetical protein